GRAAPLIGRERQGRTVRQPHDMDGDAGHFALPPSASAMCATSMAATATLDCVGQCSTPFAVTRWIVLASPPMTPLSAETSFARIQSHPLRQSLAVACSTTFSVSAPKPITTLGRFVFRFLTRDG